MNIVTVNNKANRAQNLAESHQQISRNLFDGKFYGWSVAGTPGSSALLYDGYPNRLTAVAPIEAGKSYTAKANNPDSSDYFRVATHPNIPDFSDGVSPKSLTSLLVYNDILNESTFTADVTGYVFVTIGSVGQDPKLQIEEGDTATEYIPHHIIKQSLVEETISTNATLTKSLDQSKQALNKLNEKELFPKLTNTEMIPTDPGARFVEYFDGQMWGYTGSSGEMSYSTDEGTTWTVHTATWDTAWGWVSRIVPTSDGEVIALTTTQIRKSSGWATGGASVTWSANKVTPYNTANFNAFGFDGDGTKFILVEYDSAQETWSNSRYGYISTDSGETFTQVWDSVAIHGSTNAGESHLHGACYDRWADRFYLGEGHGNSGGLYYSEDDGATWNQGEGHKAEVLRYSDGTINAPTVIFATDEGLVMGSDNRNNGLFGLVRKDNPQDEEVEWIYKAEYEHDGLIMFAQRGWRDPDTGTVYVTFRSEFSDVPPIICAGTPTSGGLVYEYPNLPVQGASDRYAGVAKTADNRLVAYAQFGGTPYTLRGDLQYPNTEINTLIRLQLKELGLI